MWIETKVKYLNDDGKKVSESNLVNAESFADAEQQITHIMSESISGEFEVDAVKKYNVSEIFRGDGIFYQAKVGFVTLDEKSGAEKTTVSNMLVQAKDFDEAVKNLYELMKGTMSDWRVLSLGESNILEIYDNRATAED